jgi:hypothetical protein
MDTSERGGTRRNLMNFLTPLKTIFDKNESGGNDDGGEKRNNDGRARNEMPPRQNSEVKEISRNANRENEGNLINRRRKATPSIFLSRTETQRTVSPPRQTKNQKPKETKLSPPKLARTNPLPTNPLPIPAESCTHKEWKCTTCLHTNTQLEACSLCTEANPFLDRSSDDDHTDRLVKLSEKKHESFEDDIYGLIRTKSEELHEMERTIGMSDGSKNEFDQSEEKDSQKKGKKFETIEDIFFVSQSYRPTQPAMSSLSASRDGEFIRIPFTLYSEWERERDEFRTQLHRIKEMVKTYSASQQSGMTCAK